MTQVDDNIAIFVIRIHNENRLGADVTEDFIAVNREDYPKALRTVSKIEKPGIASDIDLGDMTIRDVKEILDKAGIKYQHLIEGRRFYFGGDVESDGEE